METEVAPGATLAVAAREATALFELVRATVTPPAGAGAFSVTVSFTTVDEPPTTVVGATDAAVTLKARIMNDWATDFPFRAAVILT